MDLKRIVIKVGTSTLTYENGKANLRRIDKLCKVLSDIHNQGREIILVSSGAVGIGMGKLGLPEKPKATKEKQALAAVGQCELMFMYDKLFGEYNNMVAQVLLTRDTVDSEHRKENVLNTFNTLLSMGIIPIVNENDSVAVEEIVFGDNDSLSAHVAKIVDADLLVILTDIDGLFSANPREDENAVLIHCVEEINDDILALAGGTGTSRGTGGMITKLHAAQIATEAGIDTVVMNGSDPEELYKLLDGRQTGTLFKAKR